MKSLDSKLPTLLEISPTNCLCLDENTAVMHFLGKDLEEAYIMYEAHPIFYSDDLAFMGPKARRFYIPIINRYILAYKKNYEFLLSILTQLNIIAYVILLKNTKLILEDRESLIMIKNDIDLLLSMDIDVALKDVVDCMYDIEKSKKILKSISYVISLISGCNDVKLLEYFTGELMEVGDLVNYDKRKWRIIKIFFNNKENEYYVFLWSVFDSEVISIRYKDLWLKMSFDLILKNKPSKLDLKHFDELLTN